MLSLDKTILEIKDQALDRFDGNDACYLCNFIMEIVML